jgi:hypothetical protein
MAGGESDGGGGQPGTSTGPGAHGGSDTCAGTDGTLGSGGAGGSPQCSGPGAGAGGGGGGVYGGGGGGGSSAAGGGGGGSSGFGAGTTNTSVALDSTGSPAVTLVYTAPGGGGGGGGSAPVRASVSGLGLTNSVFAVGAASTPRTGATTSKRHKTGTTFSFQLDRAATVKIAIQRRATGRRDKGKCKASSRRLRTKPKCTRTITVGTLTRTAHPGLNTVVFSGRIGHRPLSPRPYRAVFKAVDAAGTSSPHSVGFTIVKH